MHVQPVNFYLPETVIRTECQCPPPDLLDDASKDCISAWLEHKVQLVIQTWEGISPEPTRGYTRTPEACIEPVLNLLAHHCFNYQSRGKVAHLFPTLRLSIKGAVEAAEPITFFLLYNGGYRGSPLPGALGLTFRPDQTEFMLLIQIALLQQRLSAFHRPGIKFVIVVNNGVASWVNNISRCETEAYAARLRYMIRATGAETRIQVLVQTELPGYSDTWTGKPVTPQSTISATDHRVVERFLGRTCSAFEARHRSALYLTAEAAWWETLKPLAVARKAIILRQVADPSFLSFRPFPGGAIRIQNGTVGFVLEGGDVIPKLLTTANFGRYRIIQLPLPVALQSVMGTSEIAYA